MAEGSKQAFLVADNFVRVGAQLYPVTHRFIVKEESEWIDDFEGEILECYNCAVALRPGCVYEMNQGGGHTFSITFANTRLRNGGIMLTPPHSIYEMECARAYGGYLTDFFVRYLEFNTGSWIGNTGLPNSYTGFNQIATLSYKGIPDLYYPSVWVEGEHWTQATYYWYEGWFDNQHPGRPQQDYVFWLYANSGKGWDNATPVTVDIPPFSNFRDSMHVIPYTAFPSSWNAVQHTDTTFLPGQQGLRIISNKWKNAPWERYPHLM